MSMIIICFLLVHLFGAIISIIICCKDGTMEDAVKYGDGISFSTPSDVVFIVLFCWEFLLIVMSLGCIDSKINDFFEKRYNKNDRGGRNE